MKETGIIMSGNHPKLILDKLKTMTRRTYGLEKVNDMPYLWEKPFYSEEYQRWGFWQKNTGDVIYLKCPYGQVGDKLWIRETFDYIFGDEGDYLIYKADKESEDWFKQRKTEGSKITWKPSIFMPRWASRITLEITGVRVERVQGISVEDCISEGYPFGVIPEGLNQTQIAIARVSRRGWFQTLWDSLNAKRGYGWDFNPWVWPISFKKEEK